MIFSRDGSKLCTMNSDFTMSIWELDTRRELTNFEKLGTWCIALSPDGELLATGDTEPTATLWGTADGKKMGTFTCNSAWICSVAFSPDGKMLATGHGFFDGDPGEIRVWDFTSKKQKLVFEPDAGTIQELFFDPSGRALFSRSTAQQVRRFDLVSGKEIGSFMVGGGRWDPFVFDPTHLMATSFDGTTIKRWDLATMKQLSNSLVATPVSYEQSAASLQWVATGNRDVKVWNASTGELRATFESWGDYWIPSDSLNPPVRPFIVIASLWVVWLVLWQLTRTRTSPTSSPSPTPGPVPPAL